MRNSIFSLMIMSVLISCGAMSNNYVDTAFYAKNTSDETISFEAGIFKNSMTMGRFEVKNTMHVNPQDSVLIIRRNFKKDYENPQHMFSSFSVIPPENTAVNDPDDPKNWKKYIKDNLVIYTFKVNK